MLSAVLELTPFTLLAIVAATVAITDDFSVSAVVTAACCAAGTTDLITSEEMLVIKAGLASCVASD